MIKFFTIFFGLFSCFCCCCFAASDNFYNQSDVEDFLNQLNIPSRNNTQFTINSSMEYEDTMALKNYLSDKCWQFGSQAAMIAPNSARPIEIFITTELIRLLGVSDTDET